MAVVSTPNTAGQFGQSNRYRSCGAVREPQTVPPGGPRVGLVQAVKTLPGLLVVWSYTTGRWERLQRPRSDSNETTASHEDVTVTRSIESTDGGLVGTVRIRSTSSEPVVLVHVVDEFPADLPVEAVGFQNGEAPDSGEITPQRASMKQAVEDEPVRIRYGLKLSEPVEGVELGPPVIRGVETAAMTRSKASPSDGGGPSSGDSETPDSSGSSSSTPSGSAGGTPGPAAGGAEEQVTDGGEGGDRRSVEARIDWLSARVGEFAAYTDALEELIDQHGTAPEFIDRIEGEVAGLDERLDDVDDRLGSLRDRADDIESGVREDVDRIEGTLEDQAAEREALEGRIDGLESELGEVREAVRSVEGDVSGVSEEVSAMCEDLDAIRAEVDRLSEMGESLADVFEPLAGQETPADD